MSFWTKRAKQLAIVPRNLSEIKEGLFPTGEN